MDTVVMAQVVIESPVTLVRTFLMNLLNRICKAFILRSSSTQLIYVFNIDPKADADINQEKCHSHLRMCNGGVNANK